MDVIYFYRVVYKCVSRVWRVKFTKNGRMKRREAYEKNETTYGIYTVGGCDADNGEYADGDCKSAV